MGIRGPRRTKPPGGIDLLACPPGANDHPDGGVCSSPCSPLRPAWDKASGKISKKDSDTQASSCQGETWHPHVEGFGRRRRARGATFTQASYWQVTRYSLAHDKHLRP